MKIIIRYEGCKNENKNMKISFIPNVGFALFSCA
jgi:hypothetical protein